MFELLRHFPVGFFSSACFPFVSFSFLQFHFVLMCQIDSVVSLEIHLRCQQLIYVFWNCSAIFLSAPLSLVGMCCVFLLMIRWIFSQLIIQNGIKLYIQVSPCCHKFSCHFNTLILFVLQLWKHLYCSSLDIRPIGLTHTCTEKRERKKEWN